MPQKKLVFLGSKPIGYECFSFLLSKKEELDIEICGLLTNVRKEFGGGHDLASLAAEHNIPVIADAAAIPACDIVYSVQYNKILKQEQIDKASELAVNLHMAPLPEYRGANQFTFAIIDDKKEFGTTIHLIDHRIDHGDILFEKRFPVPERCWVNDLYQLTFEASVSLFEETLADVINGNYSPVPQAALIEKYGSSLHFRNEINELKCIDINWPEEKKDRYIRATSMPGFEPPYYMQDGKKVYFSQEQA
jgi:methionyl-tRNA formyltransferase